MTTVEDFLRSCIIIDIDIQHDFTMPSDQSSKTNQKVQPLVMTCIVSSERFSAYEYVEPKLLTM